MDSDHDVLVYDLLLYEESYRKPVQFVYGDIRDKAKLKPYLDWADVVVWLAALVGDPACTLNELLTTEINKNSYDNKCNPSQKRKIQQAIDNSGFFRNWLGRHNSRTVHR